MAATVNILAFAGSTRKASFNKILVRAAAASAEKSGAKATVIDLADFPMPMYDEDLEAASGLPEHAKRLKDLFKSHHGLLIASPEYNSSLSAVLKNTIDWVSRPSGDSKPLEAFDGKVAGIMSTSPGPLGGLRGLVHLRAILSNIKVLVVPEQIAVGGASTAFDEQGRCKDVKHQAAIDSIAARVAHLGGLMHGGRS